ncbi:hypothetical protein MKX07_001521 [Trichoderma sp. CBMAI-0711]|nr:hypothetical protein MKX07_001521 [Trichoderma sp. CBMAI-0711]
MDKIIQILSLEEARELRAARERETAARAHQYRVSKSREGFLKRRAKREAKAAATPATPATPAATPAATAATPATPATPTISAVAGPLATLTLTPTPTGNAVGGSPPTPPGSEKILVLRDGDVAMND